MDDQTLNQRLHEARGLCWHEWEVVDTPHPCLKCGKTQTWRERFIDAHPDYTSASSPRFLLEEVERKVIEQVGKLRWFIYLSRETGSVADDYETISDPLGAATATASQRARACARALGITGE